MQPFEGMSLCSYRMGFDHQISVFNQERRQTLPADKEEDRREVNKKATILYYRL